MHKVSIGLRVILFGKERYMNQLDAVRDYLESGNTITSMEAIQMFGATRLSDIIFRLRKRGYIINTINCECTNRFGHHTTYAKYVLLYTPKEN